MLGQAGKRHGALAAFGGFVHIVVNVGKEFAGGHRAILVEIGFPFQALQQVIGEDPVTAAPFVAFIGELADIAGGDRGAVGVVGIVREILIDEVVGFFAAPSLAAEAITVAGVGKGDDALGLEHAGKDVLQLPHGKGGAAHVFELGVVGEEIQIARVVGVRGAMAGDIQDDFIWRLSFGEEGEKGASDILGGGIFVQEHANVVFGERTAIRGIKKVAKIAGVAVGELKIGQTTAGVGIVRDANDHGVFVSSGAFWSDRNALHGTSGSGTGVFGGLQKKGGVVNARLRVGKRYLHGVAALVQLETRAVAKVQFAENSVGHGGGGHDDVGGVGVDLGKDAAGSDLAGTLAEMDEQLIDIGGSDDGGAVGVHLQLELRDFERDGLAGIVGGGGRPQKHHRKERERKT